jgi:hypothetical protein
MAATIANVVTTASGKTLRAEGVTRIWIAAFAPLCSAMSTPICVRTSAENCRAGSRHSNDRRRARQISHSLWTSGHRRPDLCLYLGGRQAVMVMWTGGRKAAVLRRNVICSATRTSAKLLKCWSVPRSSSAPLSATVSEAKIGKVQANPLKHWCREGESNPQKPKLGGF